MRSGRRSSASGRVELPQHPRYIPLYATELPGLAKRLPETTGLVAQPEIQRLDTRPYPSTCDAFEVEELHPAPPRDSVLELGVDASDLAFDHPQFVRAGPAARVEKAGTRPPFQGDGVDTQLLVESERDGTVCLHTFRPPPRSTLFPYTTLFR